MKLFWNISRVIVIVLIRNLRMGPKKAKCKPKMRDFRTRSRRQRIEGWVPHKQGAGPAIPNQYRLFDVSMVTIAGGSGQNLVEHLAAAHRATGQVV